MSQGTTKGIPIDIDSNLIANSDQLVSSQKAVKTYIYNSIISKADLSSPLFTGSPSLPTGTIGITQSSGDNSTKISTTAYVDNAISYKRMMTGTSPLERWYVPSQNNGLALSTNALAKDILKFYPFEIKKLCTLDRIGAEITIAGTAGSLFQLGIYTSTNLYPLSQVLNSTGTIAGDSATFQSFNVNITLTPGIYFFGQNHNSTANITVRALAPGGVNNLLGFPNTGGSAIGQHLSLSQTYSGGYVLPDPATAGATVSTQSTTAIYIRLSA